MNELYREDNFEKCLSMAKNPEASRSMLSLLAGHPRHEVRMSVAGNMNTRDLIGEKLANDPHPLVLIELACNPWISEETALILAKSEYVEVRRELARSTSNAAILEILAQDESVSVACLVAANSDLPFHVCCELTYDKRKGVRQILAAYNIHKLPDDILKIWVMDRRRGMFEEAEAERERRREEMEKGAEQVPEAV